MTQLVLIGAGNMARSLIGGLTQKGFTPAQIMATDPDPERLAILAKTYGIKTSTDNLWAAAQADILIFAIKPQVFASVARSLAATLQAKRPLLISIAAGIDLHHMHQWLGESLPIVRCMPNTPALVGVGATGMVANRYVTPAQRQWVDTLVASIGIGVWVEEEGMLDTVTALSGSGPAYFFLVMEAMQQAAQVLGLSPEVAQTLTVQTALGAAQMATTSPTSVTELRHQVTSPGGTTEQALKVLTERGIREIFLVALTAAKQRSLELAQGA